MLAELFAVFKFGSTAVDAIIPVFTVGRILEAAKDVVLLFTTGQWPQGLSWVLQMSAGARCTLAAHSLQRSRLPLSQQMTINCKWKSKGTQKPSYQATAALPLHLLLRGVAPNVPTGW